MRPPPVPSLDKVRNVPFINAVRKYNHETNTKEYVQTPDVELFKQKIAAAFPDRAAKIMVCCSDGRKRAPAALDILDGMGYNNIVGLKGGANLWMRTWDKKLKRRDLPGEYCSDYTTPGDIQQFAVGIGSRAVNAGDAHVYDDLHDETPWLV
jgi:rhodanese-related sulfurtransferase